MASQPAGGGRADLAALYPAQNARLDAARPAAVARQRERGRRIVREVVEVLVDPPVQKHQLRSEGVTADTWDREAAGVQVRRTRL